MKINSLGNLIIIVLLIAAAIQTTITMIGGIINTNFVHAMVVVLVPKVVMAFFLIHFFRMIGKAYHQSYYQVEAITERMIKIGSGIYLLAIVVAIIVLPLDFEEGTFLFILIEILYIVFLFRTFFDTLIFIPREIPPDWDEVQLKAEVEQIKRSGLSFREKASNLLRINAIKATLELLNQYPATASNDLKEVLIIQEGNFTQLTREIRKGTLSTERVQIQYNQIKSILLDMIEGLPN